MEASQYLHLPVYPEAAGVGQLSSLSMILCDEPNIGKTYSAKYYIGCHENAVYIDCSQVKTKRRLIRKIATEFGTDNKERTAMCMKTWYLSPYTEQTAIILDEAGDFQYEAFLELKALWNATEHCCGWYMMEPTD